MTKKPATKAKAPAARAVAKAAALPRPAPRPKARPPAKPTPAEAPERYWEAVGRRKTAVARVRLFTRGEKGVLVNGRPLGAYFTYPRYAKTAVEAFETMNIADRFRVTTRVVGGGPHAQAEAIRHGSARALVLFNPEYRKRLKRSGFLTRDPRMKERKKPGLKGARKAPQWAKR